MSEIYAGICFLYASKTTGSHRKISITTDATVNQIFNDGSTNEGISSTFVQVYTIDEETPHDIKITISNGVGKNIRNYGLICYED